MSSSTVSAVFLSRADMLKRHSRIQTIGRPLNVIMEEDELRMPSRSPSPSTSHLGLKARRRHAMANIRVIRDDSSGLDSTFLCPRPAPRPCSGAQSPQSSPDSLKLAFSDLSEFPCPPPSASPAPSVSDLSSSPGAQSTCMPLTPSTSDDDGEFLLPSPRFNPRRAAMQPFSIQKPSQNSSFLRLSKSSSIDSFNDSESESDWEWYNREMSKLISLPSMAPSVPSQQQQPSRPESMFMNSEFEIPSPPLSRRRVSGSYSSRRDSRDTLYPHRRNSKTRSIMIPKCPPPPVPSIPAIHLIPSPTPSRSPSPCMPLNISRPPPRSSLPADVFDLYMDGTEGDAESDGSSAFSFSMYDIDFGEREIERPLPPTPGSAFSRSSFGTESQELELDDATFELDYQFRLPLSIPGTPLDLETDIAMGLEKLREEEDEDIEISQSVVEQTQDIPPTANSDSDSMPQDLVNRLYTPTISSFSFSPSPSPVSFREQENIAPSSFNEERVLKSKWSSSTLGSVHEEHGRRHRSTSSKLRLYFSHSSSGGGSHSGKGASGHSKNSPAKVPPTPTSPFGFKSPSRKTKPYSQTLSPSSSRQPQTHKRGNSSSMNNSDVIVIGYGANGTGLKRRGSTATVSDVGSEDSASSSSSSGLRRKPIPIEMFLRNAA